MCKKRKPSNNGTVPQGILNLLGVSGVTVHTVCNRQLIDRFSTPSVQLEAFTEKAGNMFVIYHRDGVIPKFILAHELAHVCQMHSGRLSVTDNRDFIWEGQLYTKAMPYNDRPWEKEALKTQKNIIKLINDYDQKPNPR